MPDKKHDTCIDVTRADQPPRSEWVCGPECPCSTCPTEGSPLAIVRAKGCTARVPSIHYDSDDNGYKCRCIVCSQCKAHTGNSTQGHYWSYCKVTKTNRDFHFCCPNHCELECPDRTMIKEQEATIQKLKQRLEYWADELMDRRHEYAPSEFDDRIAEMRTTAEQL